MKFSLEQSYKIFNDDDGSYLEVCPDADGLDCVEIRSCLPNGKIEERMTILPEQAVLLSKAISMLADQLVKK